MLIKASTAITTAQNVQRLRQFTARFYKTRRLAREVPHHAQAPLGRLLRDLLALPIHREVGVALGRLYVGLVLGLHGWQYLVLGALDGAAARGGGARGAARGGR